MPLGGMWSAAVIMGLVDGPTEVHRTTVARQVLKGYQPVEGLWPSQHLPARRAAAEEKYARYLEHETEFVTGGASNDLFSVTRGDYTVALRKPPEVVPPGRNNTMVREHRLL